MNASKIRERLKSIYQCEVSIRSGPFVNGALDLAITFSNLPPSLEGLDRFQANCDIAKSLDGVIDLPSGSIVNLSYKVRKTS